MAKHNYVQITRFPDYPPLITISSSLQYPIIRELYILELYNTGVKLIAKVNGYVQWRQRTFVVEVTQELQLPLQPIYVSRQNLGGQHLVGWNGNSFAYEV